VVVFPDVAAGAYAFAALHDENGDRRMQRGGNGRPKEGWAISKSATLRARPRFADVMIQVPAGGLTLTEPMIYPGMLPAGAKK
jgi:uncharacterized protein (DUF2141 family)